MANTTQPPPGGGSWATPHDWATHRETITALYEGQNMTLKRIMHIMEHDHNFFATERMYKSRLKQWGLRKNYRYEEVNEIIRQQSTRGGAGKPPASQSTTASGRARKADTKRVKAYLRRQTETVTIKTEPIFDTVEPIYMRSPGTLFSTEQQPTPSPTALSCRSRSPPGMSISSFMFPLTPPAELKAPEESAFYIQNYFDGAFDKAMWDLSPVDWLPSNRGVVDWFNRVALARGALAGGHTKQGFKLLQGAFDDYKNLLTVQDPRLFLYTAVALFLMSQFPDIVDMLLKYMCSLSGITLGPGHPLHKIFSQLNSMGRLNMMKNASNLFQCQIDMFRKHLPVGNQVLSSITVFAARNLAVTHLIDTDAAESMLLSVPNEGNDTGRITQALAQVYGSGGRYAEARKIVNDLLETGPQQPRTKAGAFDTLFYVCRLERNDALIRDASQRRLHFCMTTFGPKSEWSVDAATDFETYLREIGDDDTADRVFSDYGINMEALTVGMKELEIKK